MIASTREMLFSALRDIVYTQSGLDSQHVDLDSSRGLTDYVFQLLRNPPVRCAPASSRDRRVLGRPLDQRGIQVHTKRVGHELGLRNLDVCPAADRRMMKGPMKGATISHAKQRIVGGRYLGLTEPGIIAAEAPNPIVNELVILPNEKRLKPSSASATGSSSSPAAPGPRRSSSTCCNPHAPGEPGPALPGHLTGPAAPKPTCSSSP